MRVRSIGILALALLAACASDAAGPVSPGQLLRGEGTLLAGRVFGVKAGPDSSMVPARGAEIVVYRVDSIPTDTVPVDTVPSDSMLWNGLVLRPFVLDSGVIDTIPVDTIPPDTAPPPPPPEPGCGRTGEIVARVTTREGGRFRIAGLAPAKYDLRITPPPGKNFGTAFYCGVHLLPRQPAEITIYLPPKWGLD